MYKKPAKHLHDMTRGMIYWLSCLNASSGMPIPPRQSNGPQHTIISFPGSLNTHNSL